MNELCNLFSSFKFAKISHKNSATSLANKALAFTSKNCTAKQSFVYVPEIANLNAN